MFEPLRFLHVADAGLDQPLGDAGPFPEPLQQLAEDATLEAFEQMIAGAIAHRVDCVLLAGNTFREEDQSLRARFVLLEGLRELEAHNISVFVLPGSDDPESAWRKIPHLPGNVSLLTTGELCEEELPLPLAILREGRLIATITAGTLSQLAAPSGSRLDSNSNVASTSENGHVRSSPFRIGLVTDWPADFFAESRANEKLADRLSACRCDYLAVPPGGSLFEAGQTLETRDGIAHHPGRLQARSARETGPHGATLIEVDHAGEIRGTFLPFASARYLRLEAPVESSTAIKDLAATMMIKLLEETEQPGERVWFVTWLLQGGGTFLKSLEASDLAGRLIEALPKMAGANDSIRLQHRLQFQEPAFPKGDEETLTNLERHYLEALEHLSADESALQELLSTALRSEIANLEERSRDDLMPLARELVIEEALAQARSLGSEWFRDGF
jgi:DNA repair protein SbcD/Mre11